MPKWHVEIYIGNDVLHLGEPFVRVEPQSVVSFLMSLNEPSLQIVKVESYHFWVSPDFDSLTEEEQVLEYAKNQLPILNGILQLKFDPNICSVKIGDVFHPDENGGLARSTMRATLTGSSYPDESVLQAKDAQKPTTLEILFLANNNVLVAEALQHLATSHNWYSLIKIFEIIRKDAGKKENNGTLPRGTFDTWTQGRNFGRRGPGKSFDFLQTAHSYHWSGLSARHSSAESSMMAGVNPMALSEAIEYISCVFMKWLQTNP